MIRFSLFNTPISVHWIFWLLVAFIGGGLRAQGPQDYQYVLTFMAAAFVSIVAHELGHALTGRKLGAPRAEISLHGLGGMAQFPGAAFTRGQHIVMTAAGPATSIALACVFFGIGMFVLQGGGQGERLSMLEYFVATMITINIFWSIINLCPILPLDGGQILRAALGPKRITITCIISFITLGILTYLLWINTRSIYNLVIMVLLGSFTWKTLQQARADKARSSAA